MARSRCTCGHEVLWKADEPQSDEWLLVAAPDVPDDLDHLSLGAVTTQAAFCPVCGRLWIAWGDDPSITEYVPADPAVRAVRRTPRWTVSDLPADDAPEV
jgi:hypothetical protein